MTKEELEYLEGLIIEKQKLKTSGFEKNNIWSKLCDFKRSLEESISIEQNEELQEILDELDNL